jgi:hypothetical protein
MDQIEMRNRLLVATGMWKEATGEALPRIAPGQPEVQIREFELKLVDRLWETATPVNARDVADRTWDLVHDRPDSDPVKQRVVECHEALARMTRLGDYQSPLIGSGPSAGSTSSTSGARPLTDIASAGRASRLIGSMAAP